jgi:hypothetical protein
LGVVKFNPVQAEVRHCGISGPSQHRASSVINNADVTVFVRGLKNVTLDTRYKNIKSLA